MDVRILRISSPKAAVSAVSSPRLGGFDRSLRFRLRVKGRGGVVWKASAFVPNGSISERGSDEMTKNHLQTLQGGTAFVKDAHNRRSRLESLFCYDNAIPEERIEKPVGLSVAEKVIVSNPRCEDCWAKGAVLCKHLFRFRFI